MDKITLREAVAVAMVDLVRNGEVDETNVVYRTREALSRYSNLHYDLDAERSMDEIDSIVISVFYHYN